MYESAEIVTEKTIDLDQHRGMAAQKATELRRLLADVEADQKALRLRQDELEPSISEIGCRKFVGCFALPLIRLHCRRVDQGSISIKCEKQTCLVARHIRLEPFERIFGYKERPLHGAIMSPKPNGTTCWIENPALIWEADH